MEPPKLSFWGQITFAAILALTVETVLLIWILVAQIPGGFDPSGAHIAVAYVNVGVLFLALVWFGQKLGFVGGIGYGIFNLIAVAVSLTGAFGEVASEALVSAVVSIIVSLVLIFASWMALRE